MALLNAFTYALSCTKRGHIYFPTGIRQGLFINIDTGDGCYALGEYAPYEGIHQHGITDVLTTLQSLGHEIGNQIFSLSPKFTVLEHAEYFANFSEPWGFLFSMAHYHRWLKNETRFQSPSIKLSALIESNNIHDAVMVANAYVTQGFSCLKVKVGSMPVEEEIKKLKTIALVGGRGITLRLDANKRFCLSDAIALVKGLKKINIEYFEEPLSDMADAKKLHEETGVNIAIDESFLAPFDVNFLIQMGIQFLVIKPSRFKSIYHAMLCAKEAKHYGIVPIFSHCFESEFSAAIFAHLVDSLGLYAYHHGIFADGFFKHGAMREPLRSLRGQLFLDGCHKLLCSYPRA